MSSANLKNIASIVKESLPFHIREGDYDNFVRFIELYYEWLSVDGNPLDVLSEITDYGDIDKTLDIFVNQFKSEIGAVFPSVTRIRDENTDTKLLSSLFSSTASSNSENQTFPEDNFIGNGIVSEFLMSYRDPSYYFERDISPYVVDLKVFCRPADIFSGTPAADNSLLTFSSDPDETTGLYGDYTLLTEDTDYFLNESRLLFGQENNVIAPVNGASIKVVFQLRTNPNSSPDKNIEEEKKKKFTDQNHFMKLLRDFYQSKGSQKSLQFLFRAFLNEDIDVYYPKENIFKLSDNNWVQNKSVRTNPNTTSLPGNAVRIIGETSSAVGIVESKQDYTISNFNVNEYFLGDIVGEFQDRENVFVEMDDGRLVKEQLYSCVTGFEITNPGSNYPINFNLDSKFTNIGTGTGTAAKITNTTSGEVSNIVINQPGDNYITGEFVNFSNDGTFGSGAIGRISKVSGTETAYDITWTQDVTSGSYPQLTWDISDEPGATYDSQTSKEVEVYLINRDIDYDNVVLLYDFDTVDSDNKFFEFKNSISSIRTNAFRENPSFGSAVGNFSLSLKGDGYVRIPTAASYFHEENSFTIDFWYYGASGTNNVVFAFNGIGQNDPENIFVMEHLQSGEFKITAGGNDHTSSVQLIESESNTWRHVLIYTSAAGTTAYLDGIEVVNDSNLIVNMTQDAVLTIGADNDDSDSGSDMTTAYYGSFRITKGQRSSTYTNQDTGEVRHFGWELDPIQTARKLLDYQYQINDVTDTISYKDYNSDGDLIDVAIPDHFSLQLKFKNIGRGPIEKVDIVNGGSGYARIPYVYISNESNGYVSNGSGSSISATGTNIGGIDKIVVRQDSTNPSQDTFGVGYTSSPTLDLTDLGDGTAEVNVITGPLCVREGMFTTDKSFASSDNRIHDGYLWQDYSYVVRVNRVIDEWRDLIKKVIHPAGMMVFGEVTLTTKIEGKKMKQALLSIFYEIIKNVDVTMKVMDGLGRWTGATELDGSGNVVNKQTPVNSQDLMSSGLILEYNNRQDTLSSLSGVSDDTPVGATVDKGEGRYTLMANADGSGGLVTDFSEINYIALNHYDRFSKSQKHYYESGIIGNFFTFYNVSEEIITGDEHRVTRSFAKFEVTSATSTDNYILLGVTLLSSYGSLDNDLNTHGNTVEFRWDKVSRGNVSRINTNWVGSIRDGADPRDEKFILHLITRQQEIPSLGTSYRSLERFKFFYDDKYQFDDLVRYRFSPYEEAVTSPYLLYYGFIENRSLAGNQVTIVQKTKNENAWGIVPVFSQNNFLGVTDFSDHDWPTTTIKEVEELLDRNYHAVLDSTVIVKPKYLVLTDENRETDGRRVIGTTNLSIERSKFNRTPQLLDNDFESLNITDIDSKYLEKTNFAHETIFTSYKSNKIPTTIRELELLTQSPD